MFTYFEDKESEFFLIFIAKYIELSFIFFIDNCFDAVNSV